MEKELRRLLHEGATRLAIEFGDSGLDRLELYFSELKKWNRKVNLIARSVSDAQILEKHFLDSLTLVSMLPRSGAHLVDVGTGGGFPGLVCKAVVPDLTLSLVEPRQKRVSFLRHISRKLKLEKLRIYPARLEECPLLLEDATVTHVTSRAVTEVGPFLEMVERFGGTGPELLLMKGPRWQEEVEKAQTVIDRSPYGLTDVAEWVLPFCGAKRAILRFNVKGS
ncbi:16S rRNA (guanine(527)-N(7))-methyltransferase RsmG [Desulforhopalus singaporensis]|uniref:Ribosomal RNA small subunit methyltransferase G n=1 Tax=Desulforhopalus singaporensis TaxID=91360 RepID=A0A1H0J472_9BACT|nr:16S rRNA (guanine(527)-N(7))-methyltransferase RsmG [Desulforhopalus singaporensis]SDO38323.1 16S rRNA m(7)G-527 methyltransferase [Desulforhopalus singaporensis]